MKVQICKMKEKREFSQPNQDWCFILKINGTIKGFMIKNRLNNEFKKKLEVVIAQSIPFQEVKGFAFFS